MNGYNINEMIERVDQMLSNRWELVLKERRTLCCTSIEIILENWKKKKKKKTTESNATVNNFALERTPGGDVSSRVRSRSKEEE